MYIYVHRKTIYKESFLRFYANLVCLPKKNQKPQKIFFLLLFFHTMANIKKRLKTTNLLLIQRSNKKMISKRNFSMRFSFVFLASLGQRIISLSKYHKKQRVFLQYIEIFILNIFVMFSHGISIIANLFAQSFEYG